ncbi:MAG: hypothetical protein AUJ48_00405 [Deltaproteobacteria bacterium CG1_02_45_11]|nr:MAG: hypothetical protein AUJ48_00405 [Deltaproteobacteria bacterium CG1_02_45_11]
MSIKNIIILILLAFLLLFTLQNTQVVEVKLLLWTVSMSRALMLLGTLLVGLIAGWFLRSVKLKKT